MMEHKTIGTVPADGPETVSLCSGGGCCPDANFHLDGTVSITDETGSKIEMSYKQACKLCAALTERGYGG